MTTGDGLGPSPVLPGVFIRPSGVAAGPFRVPAAVDGAGHATMASLIQLR